MGIKKNIAILPGDGIGEEVMAQALRVLAEIEQRFGHTFTKVHALIGGAAWDTYRNHFPEETKKICAASDAILFGSIGGPIAEQHLEKWKGCETNSILALRKAFTFNANFRPARVYPALADICPLRSDIVAKGIDVLVLRELVGDLYFGEHKTGVRNGRRYASDVAEYDEDQIASVARRAFEASRPRRKKVTSIDKANVLDTGKLWREVVKEVAREYPDVTTEHMLVDNCAMQLIRRPSDFDVILCPNMFGDILSDEAAVFPGSLGLTPSASINAQGFGMYEPSGGSAPDIAGKGIANPIAQILSTAMLLRFSFSLHEEAARIEQAVEKALQAGLRTPDIAQPGARVLGTVEFTTELLRLI